MKKLVVIGAGMASGRMLEHLFDTDPTAYQVTLFNAEPRGNYNRLMLSPVLSGEKTYEEIVTHDDAWYAEHGVTCRFGEKVPAIDRARKGNYDTVMNRVKERANDKLKADYKYYSLIKEIDEVLAKKDNRDHTKNRLEDPHHRANTYYGSSRY